MPTNAHIKYLQSCISLVSETLADEESILVIEKGQTRYGRQTFASYRVRIGTFKGLTGNSPVNLRSVVVEVNVDPPHKSRLVDESEWRPLQQ